ncbi:MAG: BON domain-containing protein [Gammaproteobacteria bacterium]|nr:BON domain-containing protein [Gammaproteobacteria bacterium]NIR98031.1 BON domain-containing protein [Gammaproteobacteria bacterium]NIT63738.1 BON domain-containing protein [Gammaproteobacteria bacterium]NIV19913.1 BON domain-containing protein [Gammaproteobacteria bacterium]NIX11402.1 BON domain-containing protein [Gammaproteobacteria bacterium]
MRRLLLAPALAAALATTGCASLVTSGAAQRPGTDDGRSPAQIDQDVRIANRINAAYVSDPLVPALDIRVTVYKGVVTLRGSMISREVATRALSLARDTPGVRRVVDRTEGPR